jgi:periplasmic protein TonB
MPRDLFGHVTSPSVSVGNRKWYTVPLSLLSHSLVVGVVIVVPLMATDILPAPWQPITVGYMPVFKPPVPPPAPRHNDALTKPVATNAIPVDAPEGITPEQPRPESGWEDAAPTAGIIHGDPNPSAILAPPPPAQAIQGPVRIGGQIRSPQKTRDVRPVYPPLALAARVQGIVIIEATIGVDGQVTNARILRSVPLLDQAALEAVRQWEYVPTTLNGVPVPVIMSVTVTFQLSAR